MTLNLASFGRGRCAKIRAAPVGFRFRSGIEALGHWHHRAPARFFVLADCGAYAFARGAPRKRGGLVHSNSGLVWQLSSCLSGQPLHIHADGWARGHGCHAQRVRCRVWAQAQSSARIRCALGLGRSCTGCGDRVPGQRQVRRSITSHRPVLPQLCSAVVRTPLS